MKSRGFTSAPRERCDRNVVKLAALVDEAKPNLIWMLNSENKK